METIIIGRREVKLEAFKEVVQNSKKYAEVCEALGWKPTTATTIQAIKNKTNELQLDISHFERQYIKSESFMQSRRNRIKSFNLSEENQMYYEVFESTFVFKPASWHTYKATIGNFLEFLGNRDFATIDITDITDYVKDKKNGEAHLRSLMIYIVKNNVCGAVEKVSKDMLVWLI